MNIYFVNYSDDNYKIKQNYLIIRKQADASQYLTVFENIINKGAKNKISLF